MAEIDFDAPGPRIEDLTIRDCWRHYFEMVVPKDAGPIQVQATRDSFYAGFVSCLCLVKRLGGHDIPEPVGVAVLARLTDEQARYLDQIMRRPNSGTAP